MLILSGRELPEQARQRILFIGDEAAAIAGTTEPEETRRMRHRRQIALPYLGG